MEKFYFDCIDSVFGFRVPKLKYVFSFFYFPLFILLFLVTPNHTEEEKIISGLFISVFILLSPMMMVPSWYFVLDKNIFIYIKFVRILNFSKIRYSDVFFLFDIRNGLDENRYQKWIEKFCVDIRYIPALRNKRIIDKCTNPLFGKKKFSVKVKNALRIFLSKDATEFFEQADYDVDYIEKLFFKHEHINFNSKIKLFEGKQSVEIYYLINVLKAITSIDHKYLSLFFVKYKKKYDSYFDLNWSAIKSYKSQIDNY